MGEYPETRLLGERYSEPWSWPRNTIDMTGVYIWSEPSSLSEIIKDHSVKIVNTCRSFYISKKNTLQELNVNFAMVFPR